MISKTYSIENVWIVLTYPNGIEENFYLKKPTFFQFGFRKIPRLPTYRDGNMKWQRGNYFYQLFVTYDYEWHEMDLRKLLVAEKIRLKFPPAFGQKHNYNEADVLLANDEVIKNYFEGLALASDTGEVVPSGAITLEFEGIDAFTESEALSLFGWNQEDVADPDDDDGGGEPDVEFSDDTFYSLERTGGFGDPIYLRKREFEIDVNNEITTTIEAEHTFDLNEENIETALGDELARVIVNRDGNVIVQVYYKFSEAFARTYLFDSECNLINTVRFDVNNNSFQSGVRIDEDNNIYVTRSSSGIRVRKYSPSLEFIFETPSVASATSSAVLYGWNVTKKYILIASSLSSAGSRDLRVYDRSTGDFEQTLSGISLSTTAANSGILFENLTDGNIIATNWEQGQIREYSEDLELLISKSYSDVGLSENNSYVSQNIDGSISFVTGPLYNAIDRDYNLLFGGVNFSEGLGLSLSRGDIGHVNSGRYVLLFTHRTTNNQRRVALVDLQEETLQDTVVITGGSEQNHSGMIADNWQLQGSGDPGSSQPPPLDQYQGSIEVTSAAASDETGTKPSTFTDLVNRPNQDSTDCADTSDTNKCFIKWKGTDYCFQLSNQDQSIIANTVNQAINNDIPGLESVVDVSPEGRPRLKISSTTFGEDDNGEQIIFLVPTEIEDDPVFSKYTLTLSGGEGAQPIDTPTDIYLGVTLFATTEAIQADESESSIAQKIYDACVAVNTSQLEFTLDGSKMTVESTVQDVLIISLDIGNAGYTFETESIKKVA